MKLDPVTQNWMMYGIVAVAATRLIVRNFRQLVAPALADVLLKSGRVKWAMRMQRWSYRCRHSS